MAFTESLTVRILGDSSGLRREIADVVSEISNLQERLRSVSSSGDQLGRSVGNISAAIRPLQQVSQFLSRITQQVQTLAQTPVSLSVQPALQALQQLMNAAQAAAGMLRLLSVGPVGPAPPQPAAPAADGNPRRMASGGLVTGPAGLDRVPTMLSAGEYVLNRSAVESLGTRMLDSLNARALRIPAQASAAMESVSHHVEPDAAHSLAAPYSHDARPIRLHSTPSVSPPSASQVTQLSQQQSTVNHFGGITIQVRESADVNGLIRDLRLQGISLRNRRG